MQNPYFKWTESKKTSYLVLLDHPNAFALSRTKFCREQGEGVLEYAPSRQPGHLYRTNMHNYTMYPIQGE